MLHVSRKQLERRVQGPVVQRQHTACGLVLHTSGGVFLFFVAAGATPSFLDDPEILKPVTMSFFCGSCNPNPKSPSFCLELGFHEFWFEKLGGSNPRMARNSNPQTQIPPETPRIAHLPIKEATCSLLGPRRRNLGGWERVILFLRDPASLGRSRAADSHGKTPRGTCLSPSSPPSSLRRRGPRGPGSLLERCS